MTAPGPLCSERSPRAHPTPRPLPPPASACLPLLEAVSVVSWASSLHTVSSSNIRILSRTSLVGQWLRLHAPNAGDPGSLPGQGTKSHSQQLKGSHVQLKTLHATTKTPGQSNKQTLKERILSTPYPAPPRHAPSLLMAVSSLPPQPPPSPSCFSR